MAESGMSLVPLFNLRKKITSIAGEDMANRILGGCVGIIDCMKPLLLLEDVAQGHMSREEYIKICGHRSSDEMELMSPRPYEDPSFPDALIKDLASSGSDLHRMQEQQKTAYEDALSSFKAWYPSKSKWIDRQIAKFIHANVFREDIRSKGVRIFCVFREYCLKAGDLTGTGNDIFMLGYEEMFSLLKGDRTSVQYIPLRKETYERYLSYPAFPNLVLGRFDPEAWLKDPYRRNDVFISSRPSSDGAGSGSGENVKVTGFAGAAGVVTGSARVIADVSKVDIFNGAVSGKFTDNTSVACADNEDIFRVGMNCHRHMSYHFVVDELILFGEHHIAVKREKASELWRLENIYSLKLALSAVKLLIYSY